MRRKDLKPILRAKDGSTTITIRLSPRLTAVLGGAAAGFGMTIEKYTIRTLKRQARLIERQAPPTRLNRRDFKRFLELCTVRSRPNAALRRAVRRYKKAIATGRLIVRD
jgi:uncharacterized protein (DUF1778 family)